MSGVYKAFRSGTHRAQNPGATLLRLKPLLPVMGISRVANVTGLDRLGIPVVMVCRPNARSIAVSQGKGLDLTAAKVSGVMEAVETYHAERVMRPLRLASFEELRYTHPLADVEGLPFCVDSNFDPDMPLLWIEGQNLLDERRLWLPFELVHANYTLPLPSGSGCFTANTNGLASGNNLVEAMLHGVCEVIERDALTLWHLLDDAARAATGVDPDSIDDAACRDVLARFERAGIEVKIWEITSDMEVAAFFCLTVDTDDGGAQPADGSGCHPSRAIALLRALTEAAQVRTTYIAGSRDDIDAAEYSAAVKSAKLQACRTLMACHHRVRMFSVGANQDGETLDEDLHWVLTRLQAVGIKQVITIDLTQPAFRLPVIRVVIPGLEGADESDDYLPGSRAMACVGNAA